MVNDRIEELIIKSLLNDGQYTQKVLPFIDENYFSDVTEKTIVRKVKLFIETYKDIPTKEAILITINKDTNLTQEIYDNISEYLSKLIYDNDKRPNDEWLLEETEKFCQEKSIHNAIIDSVRILDGTDKKQTSNAIPDLLSKALSVSFDSHIGHDYLDDSQERFDFYHSNEEKISFDLEYFNKITSGGVPNKTLNVIMAGTGIGKSLCLCHMAAANLSAGLNVLYITLEMSEKRIAERIDANLMNISLQDLRNLNRSMYEKKILSLKDKISGKLKIKEYPTATAGVSHVRMLLNELHLKSSFVPDIIYVDYLNLMISSRFNSSYVNSYTYIKSIAEELRGLAVENNVPIWSATQLNRAGYTSSDAGLENTSESFGLPATCDFMVVLMTSEKLDQLGQIMVKQLKNRYGDINRYRKFVLGIDRSKMKLFDLEQEAQQEIDDSGTKDDTPIFDKSDIGKSIMIEQKDKYKDFDMGSY